MSRSAGAIVHLLSVVLQLIRMLFARAGFADGRSRLARMGGRVALELSGLEESVLVDKPA